MRIRNNFDLDIKPYEWLYMIAVIVIIVLLMRGDINDAVQLTRDWIRTLPMR